jgi:hypothetical protein
MAEKLKESREGAATGSPAVKKPVLNPDQQDSTKNMNLLFVR